MLLIGDIHIHPRSGDSLIQMLRDFVNKHDKETSIIFVGDYVYHFAYHRPSLLALLDFFLALVGQGKDVYVLAGNHDRLGQHFVYAEAEKIMNRENRESSGTIVRPEGSTRLGINTLGVKESGTKNIDGIYNDLDSSTSLSLRSEGRNIQINHQFANSSSLHFITTPQIIRIESEDFFFLPYMLSWKDSDELNEYIDNMVTEGHGNNSTVSWLHSNNGNNSGDNATKPGNHQNHATITTMQPSKLTLIHHYYIAETIFPGLKTRFGYKDLALQPRRLDDERLILISGHIHHAFAYKNYLCIGAVWSTSPVEINQLQYLFVYDATQRKLSAEQVAFNPYLQCELKEGQLIDTDFLHTQRQQRIGDHKKYFASPQFDITIQDAELMVDRVTLSLLSNELKYEDLASLCEDNLHTSLRDIKLKRSYDTLDFMIEQLTSETQNFSSGRGDRKQLLDDYLAQKFGDRKGQYEEMLKKVGV